MQSIEPLKLKALQNYTHSEAFCGTIINIKVFNSVLLFTFIVELTRQSYYLPKLISCFPHSDCVTVAGNQSQTATVSHTMQCLPAKLDILTTRPRDFFTRGRNVLVTRTMPNKFTSIMRRIMFSVVISRSAKIAPPALLTTPHSPTQ